MYPFVLAVHAKWSLWDVGRSGRLHLDDRHPQGGTFCEGDEEENARTNRADAAAISWYRNGSLSESSLLFRRERWRTLATATSTPESL